jgi:hypothetical protein
LTHQVQDNTDSQMSKQENPIEESEVRSFASVRIDLDEELSKRVTKFRVQVMMLGNDPTYSFRQAAADLLRKGLESENITL